jgi:hypothetical protein
VYWPSDGREKLCFSAARNLFVAQNTATLGIRLAHQEAFLLPLPSRHCLLWAPYAYFLGCVSHPSVSKDRTAGKKT